MYSPRLGGGCKSLVQQQAGREIWGMNLDVGRLFSDISFCGSVFFYSCKRTECKNLTYALRHHVWR